MIRQNQIRRSEKSLNPRAIWLAVFVLINLICMIVILSKGRLLGDTSGVELTANYMIVPMTIIVISTYVGILGIAFPLISKIKIRPVSWMSQKDGKYFGYILFLLQLIFIYFFTSTGTFVAGSIARSESVWTVFWVLINVDVLFFIYYGFYRESRTFIPNLIIAVISNILRGWSGIFIWIIFMESARLIRSGRLSLRKIVFGSIFGILLYPFIYIIKLQVRLLFSGSDVDFNVRNIMSLDFSNFGYGNYLDLLTSSFFQIFERLQLISSQLVVYQHSSELTDGLSSGLITPFWMEGIHGIAYERIFGLKPTVNLGVSLANLIDPVQVGINWNANPGYASWLILSPFLTPLYLAYTLGLIFVSVCLVKRMSVKISSMDMLWFACLLYLVPGWLASFVLFVHSLIIFYIFHSLVGRFPPRRSLEVK